MKNQRENKYFLFVKAFSLAVSKFRQVFYVSVFFIVILSLSNLSCSSQYAQTAVNSAQIDLPSLSNARSYSKNSENVATEEKLIETVFDDLSVGVSRKNKVELSSFQKANYYRVELKFYSLDKDNSWRLKQTTEVENTSGLPLQMQFKDFNNDGFRDLTFISDSAARGANELRTLFIYDKDYDRLVHIKNSSNYPNLEYNKRLNSLTAQKFYGGTSTDFLKITGDILVEFACVESFGNERTVFSINEKGQRKLLRKYKINDNEIFERFTNYDPLEFYDEEQ